jgi:ribosome biogenesis GTPase
MSLESWGFSPFFRHAFERLDEPSLTFARVLRGEPFPIRVTSQAGDGVDTVPNRARTVLPGTIVAGDWIALDERDGVVRQLLPRRTAFVRRAAGKAQRVQVVAANFDVAFVLMSLDRDFSLRRLERYLALTAASGADAVVLLTKAARATSLDDQVREATSIARSSAVHAIDVIGGISADVPGQYLREGVTAVLLGSSGVGKSTLLNHLLGGDHAQTTPVRAGDDKGRHTTTHRELFRLPAGGCVIDTPGMRELALHCDADALRATFDDVAHVAERCRFRDCGHREEPDCAVRLAVESGDLDGERVASFAALLQETQPGGAERRTRERRAQERLGGRLVREAKRHKYGRDE